MASEILLLAQVLAEKLGEIGERMLDSKITGIVMIAFLWLLAGIFVGVGLLR